MTDTQKTLDREALEKAREAYLKSARQPWPSPNTPPDGLEAAITAYLREVERITAYLREVERKGSGDGNRTTETEEYGQRSS
jgi:hypothetical protein